MWNVVFFRPTDGESPMYTDPRQNGGGPRDGHAGTGRPAKRRRFSPSGVGRSPGLTREAWGTPESREHIEGYLCVAPGTFVTAERARGILRFAYASMQRIWSREGESVQSSSKKELVDEVKGWCSCSTTIAWGATEAILTSIRSGDSGVLDDFIYKSATENWSKWSKLKKLTPELLAILYKLIQAQLLMSDRARIHVDLVRELCRSHMDVDVGRETARKALHALGYRYCKLRRHVLLTSKRRATCETFISRYARANVAEAEGSAVIAWMDESYIHAGYKPSYGWDVRAEVENAIHSCLVEQEVDVHGRHGELKGGQGSRHAFLCAITRDGIVKGPAQGTEYLRSSTYESPILQAVGEHKEVDYLTSTWMFRCQKKGVKDYHDNIDSHMFLLWCKHRLIPSYKAQYWTAERKPRLILVLDNAYISL